MSDKPYKDGHEENSVDELPGIFKSWRRVYAIVLGELVLLIFLFYLFTTAYS